MYAIAIGGTLSSGFFLLPGIAAVSAGPALPLSYLIAALFLVPGFLCKAELVTAMPRSGGIYVFIDRTLGPLWGTMIGFGTWFALILKTAFALIGAGAYLAIFVPDVPITPIAAAVAVIFGLVNVTSVKKSGFVQIVLIAGILSILLWFFGVGAFQVQAGQFAGFLDQGASSIISTAGLVVVSYMGLSKVASIAEEVKNPVRNLPLGMFLAFGTVIGIYLIGTSIMIGVISAGSLAANGGDLTPVATVAEYLVGGWGKILMSIAAILACSSVVNSGILSASRYPFAMGRDKLLPESLGKVRQGSQTPTRAIILTLLLVLGFVLVFPPIAVAKIASSFKLLMFAMSCAAVVIMRESHILSYDPGYRSPLYPWLHVFGVLAPLWLITQNGILSIAFTGGMMLFGVIWYRFYAKKRVNRHGAILNVFRHLGQRKPND